ncbi:hypothetical protein BH09MYX1_BH09MYX1_22360 [soil metagenome]
MRSTLLLAALLGIGLHAPIAHAETCPVPDGADPKLAAVDPKARVHFLQAELGAQARYADLWQTTWFVARSAILVGEVGLALITTDPGDRTDAIVTSIFAVVPPIGTLLFGLRVSHDGPRFLRLDHLDTDASRCAYIARGEQFLARDAANEDENRNWVQHALQIAGSTALFLVLGLGYDHFRNAILNGAGGIALGELQILSQPTGLVSAWKRYRAADIDPPKPTISLRPTLTATSGGVMLSGTF